MSAPDPAKTSYPFWRSRWGIAAAIVVLVGGGLVAIDPLHWRGSKANEQGSLIVGDQRGGAEALLRAAGQLENVPYKIQFAQFPAASPLLEALDSKAVDVGGIGGAPFAFAYGSGAKIKAVHAYRPSSLASGRASAIIVGKDSPLHTVADLKGKRVATIKGSAGQNFVLRLLEKQGLKPTDVNWTYLANAESKAALSTGAVDAWSTWGSYIGIAVLEDKDRVLVDASGLPGEVGFFAANDTAIAEKRGILDDYLRRLARARRWAQSHQSEYARVLAKETGVPYNVALYTVKAEIYDPIPIDDGVVAEQKDIFRRYKAAGIIADLPNIAGGYDASFNDAVEGATSAKR